MAEIQSAYLDKEKRSHHLATRLRIPTGTQGRQAQRLEPRRHYPRYEIIVISLQSPRTAWLPFIRYPTCMILFDPCHLYPTPGDAICPFTDVAMDATLLPPGWTPLCRPVLAFSGSHYLLETCHPGLRLQLGPADGLPAMRNRHEKKIQPAAFAKDISIVATGEAPGTLANRPANLREPVTSLSH